MAGEFWLSEAQWEAIGPLLPKNQPGARRTDDWRVISGIILVVFRIAQQILERFLMLLRQVWRLAETAQGFFWGNTTFDALLRFPQQLTEGLEAGELVIPVVILLVFSIVIFFQLFSEFVDLYELLVILL